MKTIFKKLIQNNNQNRNTFNFQRFAFSLHFNKSPSECYYKTLNSSPSSNPDDIKKEYYRLAKKYHPDNKNLNSKENQNDRFKIISEAYEVLSNPEKKLLYDKAVFGIFQKSSFSNQDTYDYYKSNSSISKINENYPDENLKSANEIYKSQKIKDISDKLKSGLPIDDSFSTYNKHKENFVNENKLNSESWKNAVYSFDKKFDPYNRYFSTKTYQDKYNIHNEEEVIEDIPYYETKENDAYYNLSRYTRLKIIVKNKISELPMEFYVFNFLFLLMVIYYANKKSKMIIS